MNIPKLNAAAVLLFLFLFNGFLFLPKTYIQPDTGLYFKTAEFFLGRTQLTSIENQRLTRPLFPLLLIPAVVLFKDPKPVALVMNLLLAFLSVLLFHKFCKKMKYDPIICLLSSATLLCSQFFLINCYSLMSEQLSLFLFMLLLNWWLDKKEPLQLGVLAGFLVLSKELMIVTLPLFILDYLFRKDFRSLILFSLISFGIILGWQLFTTYTYHMNFLQLYQDRTKYTVYLQEWAPLSFKDLLKAILKRVAILVGYPFSVPIAVGFFEASPLAIISALPIIAFNLLLQLLWQWVDSRLMLPMLPFFSLFSGVGIYHIAKRLSALFTSIHISKKNTSELLAYGILLVLAIFNILYFRQSIWLLNL